MANYSGSKCSVCGQVFEEIDDIVVCPDCGAPYHRACWEQAGSCVYAAKHGSDFEWMPERPEGENAGEIQCRGCGAMNPEKANFCSSCGLPVSAQQERPRVPYPGGQQGGFRYARSPMPGQSRVRANGEELVDGIKVKDWIAYIGKASPFYLVQFQRMAITGSRLATSLSAFIFGPFYFFYRKAWKTAFLLMLLGIALFIPTMILELTVFGLAPWMQNEQLLSNLITVSTILSWAKRFFCGFFGVYLYKKDAMKKIKTICQRYPEGQQHTFVLSQLGGTSVIVALLAAAVCFALYLGFVFYVVNTVGAEKLLSLYSAYGML